MALVSYKGYFKNGRFVTSDNQTVEIPDDTEIVMTFVEKEKSIEEKVKERATALQKALELLEEDRLEILQYVNWK